MGPQGDMGCGHMARISALPASARGAAEGPYCGIRNYGLLVPAAADVLVRYKLSAVGAGREHTYVLIFESEVLCFYYVFA